MVSSTYVVYLNKHWQYLPFLEYGAAAKGGDLASANQPNCSDVVSEYVQMHPELAGVLKDGKAEM